MGAEAVVRLVYGGRDPPSGETVCVSIPWCKQVPVSYWDESRTPDGRNESGESLFEPVYGYSNEPLLSIWFGLSYTEFTITPPIFEKQEREDKIDISRKVKNVGRSAWGRESRCSVMWRLCAHCCATDRRLIRFGKFFCCRVKSRK